MFTQKGAMLKSAIPFIWIRDIPASIGWILASSHLPIVLDCVGLVTRYLYKKQEYFSPITGIIWNPKQYDMFGTLYSPHKEMVIRLDKRNGATFGIIGMVASLLMTRGRIFKVCVICTSVRTAKQVSDRVKYFMDVNGEKMNQEQCLIIAGGDKKAYYRHEPDLTIIDNADHQNELFVFNIVYTAHFKKSRLLCFCDATHTNETCAYLISQPFFNVITI